MTDHDVQAMVEGPEKNPQQGPLDTRLYIVRIKGVRHLATMNYAYPDGYSVIVPCAHRTHGSFWLEKHQLKSYDGEPACWRCEKKLGIVRELA